ncbi:MAG: hypothetical protein R2698_01155 [Microthrixaceae bacterium]
MKRLVALLTSVAIIVAAVVVGRWIADTGGPDRSSDRGATGDPTRGANTLVCAGELGDVCDRLAKEAPATVEVRKETASTTLESLAKGHVTFGAWLTPTLWLDLNGRSGGAVLKRVTTIASSELEVTLTTARLAALKDRCPGGIDGRCLLDAIGRPFDELGVVGDPRVAVWGVPPEDTAAGLLAVAALTSGWGLPKGWDGTDFDANDELSTAFTTARDSLRSNPDPVFNMIRVPTFQATIAVAANGPGVFDPADRGRYRSAPLSPRRAVQVSIAATAADTGSPAAAFAHNRAAALLKDRGWRVPPGPINAGEPSAATLKAIIGS